MKMTGPEKLEVGENKQGKKTIRSYSPETDPAVMGERKSAVKLGGELGNLYVLMERLQRG